MVDDASLLLFWQFILGLEKSFTQGPAGRDGGGEALIFEDSCEGLRNAGKVWESDVATPTVEGRGG